MLKRLLLNLRSLLKLKLPLNTEPTADSVPFGVSSDISSNLLPDAANVSLSEQGRTKNVKIFQTVVIVLCSIFTFLLAINFGLDLALSSLQGRQNYLVATYEPLIPTKQNLLDIQNRTSFYKGIILKRSALADKVTCVTSVIPQELTVKSYDVKTAGFSIVLDGEKTIYFTKLLLGYLNNTQISAVTLQSAVYDTSTSTFRVTVGGTFK